MKPIEKVIIFDSGTLISLSMACLIGELKKLKSIFKGKFIISADVKREIVDKPLTIKRFELEALRIQNLIDEKVIELPTALGLNPNVCAKETQELLNIANTTFRGPNNDMHIIDSGEASCLALSKLLTQKGIKNVVAVDERTMRMLGEKPESLKKFLERKLHTSLIVKKENFKRFQGVRFIRSAELVYVAFKKGLIGLKGPRVLDALLYAVKFKGCAISGEEIKEMQKIK